MKIKSLALVAAAAVVSAGAAQAADLNRPAKVAVDYVKVCDAYGAGFFYIPGSDTCLQISGYARYSAVVAGGRNLSTVAGTYQTLGGYGSARTANSFGSAVETELDFDARTNTSFGLLRSYISLENDYNTGVAGVASTNTINMNRGYLQLGGLTAGHNESNFVLFTGYNDELLFSEIGPDYQTNMFAYTFSFGNGVTATLAIEDGNVSRVQGANFVFTPAVAGPPAVPASFVGSSFQYQGTKSPDVVANLNVTQAWGQAQIAGALHQVYGDGGVTGAAPAYTYNVSKWGFAVMGGVEINVPTLGAGDQFALEGVYEQGAGHYLGAQGPGIFASGTGFGDLGTDVTVRANGSSKLGTGYAIYGGYNHNFTPTVSLSVDGGFQGMQNTNGFSGLKDNYTLGTVAAQLTWAPVKGFSADLEVGYDNINFNSNAKTDLSLRNGDAVDVGFRVKRSF